MDMLDKVKAWATRPRTKKWLYAGLALILALWVVFRFVMVGVENRRFVFNPARDALENGVPVVVMTMHPTDGVLHEPISVKNNRAMVAPARAAHFVAGQKIGDGVIVSVARGIDLDTGMVAVRTRGVADGLGHAESLVNGFLVPIDAVRGDTVMVADGDVAVARTVTVERSDADMALVTAGLNDGDVVILTHVGAGQKIKIQK